MRNGVPESMAAAEERLEHQSDVTTIRGAECGSWNETRKHVMKARDSSCFIVLCIPFRSFIPFPQHSHPCKLARYYFTPHCGKPV